jgi:hypothetical protein
MISLRPDHVSLTPLVPGLSSKYIPLIFTFGIFFYPEGGDSWYFPNRWCSSVTDHVTLQLRLDDDLHFEGNFVVFWGGGNPFHLQGKIMKATTPPRGDGICEECSTHERDED